jgi:predicted metal-dependent phosphotriesterase family hydrolase
MIQPSNISSMTSRPIQSVLGPISYETMGITDAHNHVWIEKIAGADSKSPILDQFDGIRNELLSFRAAGGESLLDCQPAGCGRNAAKLIQLSKETGVNIIACTGFHRKKYYRPEYWLFAASVERIADYLISEYTIELEEVKDQPNPPRAGFIKIALEADWKKTPQAAMEATAAAAKITGALVEIHTEKGALAEKVTVFFNDHGVKPNQLVLCHMDKRPDLSLHTELGKYGVLVEYDTFYRANYRPEENLWPLIMGMCKGGLSNRIALATDMAEAEMYKSIGKGPGLAVLPTEIRTRLLDLNIPVNSIQEMLGGNIARRLAGLI